MIIKTLAENTAVSDEYGCEHGLSFYIETANHRILFDTGASTLFSDNAKKLDVDLATVDIAFLSHDHYDHGGGLDTFLKLNQMAKIYVSSEAFHGRFAVDPKGEKKYIGLDMGLLLNNRFVFTAGHMIIDSELELFSGVHGDRLIPSGNNDLLMMRDGQLKVDDFTHEQNLIIREGKNIVLMAGCAHNGIVNIVEHMKAAGYGIPSHVIGGFHLYNKSADRDEPSEFVERIGCALMDSGAQYYTCHCTGLKSYGVLKEVMGDNVQYLASGSQFII